MSEQGYNSVFVAMTSTSISSSASFIRGNATSVARYGGMVTLVVGATINSAGTFRVGMEASLDGVNWGLLQGFDNTTVTLSSMSGTVAFSSNSFGSSSGNFVSVQYGRVRAPWLRVIQRMTAGTTAASSVSMSIYVSCVQS